MRRKRSFGEDSNRTVKVADEHLRLPKPIGSAILVRHRLRRDRVRELTSETTGIRRLHDSEGEEPLNNDRGEERAVIDALSDVRWVFRTVRGISVATNLAEPRVTAILEDLYQRKLVRRRGTDLWGLSDEEGAVIKALRNPRFTFRTIRGIAKASDLDVASVQEIITSLERKNLVRPKYSARRGTENTLWGLLERLRPVRPLRLGLPIGHPTGTGGSIGPFVRFSEGKIGFMSTSSVLAPVNARPGDYIHQPGPRDAAILTGETRVARMTALFSELSKSVVNEVDAGIAEILPDIEWTGNIIPEPAYEAGGTIATIAEPTDLIGASVAFVGRSGYSVGRIVTVDLMNANIIAGKVNLKFNGCIEIIGDTNVFSRPGDSGGLVYRRADNAAVGMVFASYPDRAATLVLPLGPALRMLGATLA